MARRKKSEPKLPKLIQRGKAGNYSFRRKIGEKDKWFSTHTSELKEAKAFTRKFLEAEFTTEQKSRREKLPQKLALTFAEAFKDTDDVFTPVATAHDIWIDHYPKYSDLSDATQDYYDTMFKRFSEWCEKENIEYLENVDNAVAIRYSKNLREAGLTGRTFGAHIKHLSQVFCCLDSLNLLPHINPFGHENIPRVKKNEEQTQGFQPLEEDFLQEVIKTSGEYGRDYRDLMIIGSQTGMRLKDAALLRWESIKDGFIEIMPYKTAKSGNIARPPVTPVLRNILAERSEDTRNEYVIPDIAEHYQRNKHYVTKQVKAIFEAALGDEKSTVASAKDNPNRKRGATIYGFPSFRTTFMSLLASKDVSSRDAMKMLGWESMEMIRVYEKMLEKAQREYELRAKELVNSIKELKVEIPEPAKKKLQPTKAALETLIAEYSNRTIGEIYDISETAVRKWMKKFGVTRGQRIISADVSEADILAVRQKLEEESE